MRDSSPSRGAHALTFRVMRLTTPLPPLTNTPPPTSTKEPPWESEGTPCGAGMLTVLPDSFGSIYASETFRSFISVYNLSPDTIENVCVTVTLQTASQRRHILHSTDARPLQSRGSINCVVRVGLPELGVHVLICSAVYRDAIQGQKTLRQYFRFNVLPPLEPVVTVTPLYKTLDCYPYAPRMGKGYVHYLVDLRVLNAVPLPVYITQATFRATKPYLARELASSYEASIHDVERDLITGATRATMYAGDAKHYMFHLYRHLDNVPRPETFVNSERGDRSLSTREESDMRHLGHITISWRSSLGETGHIENTVTAHVPDMKAPKVEVKIHSTPSEIRVHQPFTAHIATRNNSAQAMRLYLQVRRDMVGEIVPMGVSGVSLGEIAGGEVAECCLVLMGLVKGVHSISGVRVVDVDSKTCYKADVVSCLVT